MKRTTASLAIASLALLGLAQSASADEFIAGGGQSECVGNVTWEFQPPLQLHGWQSGIATVDYDELTCTSASGSVWWVEQPVPHPAPVLPNPLPFESQPPSRRFDYDGDCGYAVLRGSDGTPAYGDFVGGTAVHVSQDQYPFYPMIGRSKEAHQLVPPLHAEAPDLPPGEQADSELPANATANCLGRATGKVVWEFTKAESAVP